MSSSLALDVITIANGVLEINTNDTCTIRNNGRSDNLDGPIVSIHVYFGLVEYNCSNYYSGKLISELTCNNCGILCPSNQVIEGCKDYWFSFTVGALSTMLIILLLLPLIRKIFQCIWKMVYNYVMYKYILYCDKRECKKVSKMIRRGMKVQHNYKEVPAHINKKYILKILKKRSMNNEINHGDIDLEANVSVRKVSRLSHDAADNVSVCSNMTRVAIGAGLVLSGLTPVVDCCDNTLYLSSNGKVCTKLECKETKTYDLPIVTGNTICFKDLNAETMMVHIEESYIRERYSHIYDTAYYNIVTSDYWECKGSGDCWMGACSKDTLSRVLKHKYNETTSGYGCIVDTLGCDTWCYHKTSCTWFVWNMLLGETYYGVYKANSQIWEIVIKIDYKGVITRHKINVNNPRVNLNDLTTSIPLYITSFTSEVYYRDNGGVIIDDKFYETTVSDYNMPESDIIGDIQINRNTKEISYNKGTVQCTVSACKVNCIHPMPKVQRVLSMIDDYKHHRYTYINDKNIIEFKRNVHGLGRLLIGNIEVNNLQVELAYCDVSILTTYSCVECNIHPYIVLQTSKIKNYGLMPVISNCTLKQDFISCSGEIDKIEMSTDVKDCIIYIPSINKTLSIGMHYHHRAPLNSLLSLSSTPSLEDYVKEVATSPGFIAGIISSIGAMTALTISTTAIARIIRVIMSSRDANREAQHN